MWLIFLLLITVLFIPYSKQSISPEDISSVTEVLSSDFLTQGPKIEDFENELSEHFNVKHAVCCSSGTSALHLSYASLGVGEKSIGIVPAITFAATANAFRYQGARVIFCDVEPETGNLCLNSLEEILQQISPKQKDEVNLISPVSFAGCVGPLHECKKLAAMHDFKIVEDASHSTGAWKKTQDDELITSGSCKYTDASCLSFHPVKHLCCGEGGAILTNSSHLAEKSRNLRSHGISRPYSEDHPTPWFYEQLELGWNYRMTDLQATLGISQLSRLDHFLNQRTKLASRYDQYFAEKRFSEHIIRPVFEKGHAWHLYIIRFKKEGFRDLAHKYLKSKGIGSQIHYLPVYRHPYYEGIYGRIRLPGAETFYSGCLSIPLYCDLMEKDQDRVVEELYNFLTSEM